MFIAARFFAGIGSWGFLAVCMLLAPPKLRGFFVGMNGVCIALGYALASYMGMAFFFVHSDQQWRGPLGIALVWPFVMLFIICFVPESPRWLLLQGRTDKARDIVMRLHTVPGDVDQEFARSEFYQMQKQCELDRTLNPSWAEMFRRPSYRKRVILACGFAFIGQSTAVLVINNYGPLLYASLGYDTHDQLALACGWITVGVIFNAVGASFMDKVGRRPLMIAGVVGCCICLTIEAAMVAVYAKAATNKAGLSMGVAAFYLFLAVYSIGIDVVGVVWYSEIFPNHIRSKGICLAVATLSLTDLVYLQATTTAFANIGWKFYLVFIVITALGSVWAFFVLPETKGIPLEELAQIFGDTDDIMVYAADIHVDATTHELVVQEHGKEGIRHIATGEKKVVPAEHVETAV
ncbi:MFS general substrate transporter [Trichodelitschia bisporula]|uniref:MFS general substrate transporter n=1 Tax=Trichodelitschia bisporula TaxID=703511 RepID=A0A6G1I6Y1_9PEZI|nr:MFS general substrate transporter [Trichodelitschia bisporula]